MTLQRRCRRGSKLGMITWGEYSHSRELGSAYSSAVIVDIRSHSAAGPLDWSGCERNVANGFIIAALAARRSTPRAHFVDREMLHCAFVVGSWTSPSKSSCPQASRARLHLAFTGRQR